MYRDSVVRIVSVWKAVPPSEYASTRDVWMLSFVVDVALIFRDILVPTAVDSLAGYILNAPTKFGGVFEYSLWTEKLYSFGWFWSVANKSNQFMR
jgi:hypothetical protein